MASTSVFLLINADWKGRKCGCLALYPRYVCMSASLFLMGPNSTSLRWFPMPQEGTETLTQGPIAAGRRKPLQHWWRELEVGQCHNSDYSSVGNVEFEGAFASSRCIWRATELTTELKLQPKMEPQQWSSTEWPQLYFDHFHPDAGQVTQKGSNYGNAHSTYSKKRQVLCFLLTFFWGLKIPFRLFLQM